MFTFTMKTLVLLTVCVAAAIATLLNSQESGVAVDICRESVCLISEGCKCAAYKGPLNNDLKNSPQLISLTFNEGLNDDLYTDYWRPLLSNRRNPDGAPIGATFFVPHEYTNYQRVNDLYNLGFEIAVHSITNNPLQSYWRGASEQLLEQEFAGQKRILSKFANIPTADIIGVRTPQLQLAGNLSFEAYVASGLTYDSSWPTLHSRALFPYTLDYLSTQQCTLGTLCPTASFKGFWVLPIVDLQGKDTECNNLASCRVNGTAEEIATWLVGEVDRVKKDTKYPLTLIVTSNWFTSAPKAFEGLNLALDRLATYDDVFLVSQRQVVDWIKNPVTLDQFKTEVSGRYAACSPIRCRLRFNNETNLRYMISCVNCPVVYPWLGNPDGDAAVFT